MSTTTPDNARNLEQKAIIEKLLTDGKDPFDRSNIESLGNSVIFENPHWYAFKNRWPLAGASTAIVIACMRNIKEMADLTRSEIMSLFEIIQTVSLIEEVDDFSFCMRFGEPKICGTTVTHLHGHLLAANQDVDFCIGNYNNPNKNASALSSTKTNSWFFSRSTDGTISVLTPKKDGLCKLRKSNWCVIFKKCTDELFKHDIKGGGICIPIKNQSIQRVILVTPNENEPIFYTIKSKNK
jgi:diadenosine tetraphosphate (Ap4A) HIT family hydrolase